MAKRILVVDDDPAIRDLVRDYLTEHGIEVLAASGGHEMGRILESETVDLVVLDVKMPGEDGFNLARMLRARSTLPIIMLTGQGHEVDRVLGLELGADDYVTKPFSPRELLARIRAVLRRHDLAAVTPAASPSGSFAEPRNYRFAGWSLATGTRKLSTPAGEKVELTNGEYSLLVTFLRAPRAILTRDQLLEGSRLHADIYDRSIDVQILRLRRKIEENPNEPRLIRTERGAGYFFDADVTTTT
ncbi:MAG: response regulator [Betaproteobacteria bacterium]|nr:response regulator [Betaproteobacteria bacterium]